MSDMSPREQANAIRNQSRALIAALRAERRTAVDKTAASRGATDARVEKRDVGAAGWRSPRGGSSLSGRTARALATTEPLAQKVEDPTKALEQRTRDAERSRRDATRKRQSALAELRRLRDTRWESRNKGQAETARASKRAAPAPPSKDRCSTADTTPASTQAAFPVGFTLSAVTSSAAAPRDDRLAGHGRSRACANARAHPPVDMPVDSAHALDIDAITGLGAALKAKLRRVGIGTVEKLAEQSPEHLRGQLGPVGRLVNIESLIRSAHAARLPIPNGVTAPRGRLP